jgi:hypothetical protein
VRRGVPCIHARTTFAFNQCDGPSGPLEQIGTGDARNATADHHDIHVMIPVECTMGRKAGGIDPVRLSFGGVHLPWDSKVRITVRAEITKKSYEETSRAAGTNPDDKRVAADFDQPTFVI